MNKYCYEIKSMWIGSAAGLCLLDKESGKFERIKLPVESSYIYSLYQAKNGSIQLMMGNCNTTLTAQQILDLNIYTFDLIDYDHDKFLEFYKLGDSNVKD